MSNQGFRFVHASNVLLDHQLRDTGQLPDGMREIAQDATLTTFDRVIDLCIEKSVDFLLLTTNTFHQRDRSLRAQTKLCSEFRKLDEAGIQVVAVVGASDPMASWMQIANLSDNVILFDANTGESISIEGEFETLATIAAADYADDSITSGYGHQKHPFAIAVYDGPIEMAEEREQGDAEAEANDYEESFASAPEPAEASVDFESDENTESEEEAIDQLAAARELLSEYGGDYLAVCDADSSFTVDTVSGIAHDPGMSQGINPRQAGPHGCTLVEVDEHKNVLLKPIRLAAVRWERPEINIEPGMSQDELAHLIRNEFSKFETYGSESMWLVNWIIRGSGELFEALHRDEVQSALKDSFAQQLHFNDSIPFRHEIHLLPNWVYESDGEASVLMMDFLSSLEGELPLDVDSLIQIVDGAHELQAPWSGRLRALATKLDPEAVAACAFREGVEWFQSTEDDES